MKRTGEVRCVEFVEQITEWLDGSLADDDRRRFEAHLARCLPCTRYLQQVRTALRLLREREVQRGSAPAHLRAALVEEFRQTHA